jgi:transcriptional regulator with XRE-family HTH domain
MGAFGPKSEQERLVFATEDLRADVQLTIQEVMFAKGITRSDLAKLLGCSPANVTQLLAEDGNPTIETIARVFYALGDVCKFQSAFLEQQPPRSGRVRHPEDQAMASWQIAAPAETESRGKRRQLQPTTEFVIQVARDAARRQVEVPAHNQNFMFRQRQAA